MSEASQDRSTLTVRLDPDLAKRFKVACAQRGTNMSKIVTEFVEWWVEKGEKKT